MVETIESSTSVHAEEGTLAHEIAENKLRHLLGFIDELTYNKEFTRLRRNKLYSLDLLGPIDEYVDFVLEQVSEATAHAKARGEEVLVLIEEKVALGEYIPEGFGTGDFIAIGGGVLYVTDLKFGRGVRVSALNNDQLKIYGLGALLKYALLYDIEVVRLTIMQPRLDAISTWDISVSDLLEWADSFVKPQAQKAFNGEGDHKPGSYCHFCNAKTICPALRIEALRLADEDFSKDLVELGDEDVLSIHHENVLEVYHVADRVRQYLAAIEEHVYQSALNGKKWEGLKLVEGRGQRSIQDSTKAMQILQRKGIPEILYKNVTVKLHGLTNLQKGLGKKNMEAYLGKLIVYSPGKPTLVDETDARPALSTASDFDDEYDDLIG